MKREERIIRCEDLSARHGKLTAFAGEDEGKVFIRLYGRILENADTHNLVLDCRRANHAITAKLMMELNGGYLIVKGRPVSEVTFCLRAVPEESCSCFVSVERFGEETTLRVETSPSEKAIKINYGQARRAGLKRYDLAENGGIFTLID